MTSVVLRKNQRDLVPYLKPYHIDEDDLYEPSIKKEVSAGHLAKNFNPEENMIDRRILYEITKRKFPGDKYSDDSSSGEDDEPSAALN